jgi:hypothetical protein
MAALSAAANRYNLYHIIIKHVTSACSMLQFGYFQAAYYSFSAANPELQKMIADFSW